jgi:hypothetical protein
MLHIWNAWHYWELSTHVLELTIEMGDDKMPPPPPLAGKFYFLYFSSNNFYIGVQNVYNLLLSRKFKAEKHLLS